MPTISNTSLDMVKDTPRLFSYQQALYDALSGIPLDQKIFHHGIVSNDPSERTFDPRIRWFLGNIDVMYQGRQQKFLFEFYTDENVRVDVDNMKAMKMIKPGTSEHEDMPLSEAQKQRIGVVYFNREFIIRELMRLKEEGRYTYPREELIRFEYRILAENFPEDPNFRHISFPQEIYQDGIYDTSFWATYNTLGFLVDLESD